MRYSQKQLDFAGFIEKFKPAKTTDDCYTPPLIYEAVRDWAVARFGLEGREIVRPFRPGGDFEAEEYPEGCLVLDNPPFSICIRICRWYQARGVPFFLFCPGLVSMQYAAIPGVSVVVIDRTIVYSNGASVNTGFCHNLTGGRPMAETAPDLDRAITEVVRKTQKARPRPPRIKWPGELVTFSRLARISRGGVALRIDRGVPVAELGGRDIYGGGLAVDAGTAARVAAAERQARREEIMIEMTDRERWIIEMTLERGGEG